jgi:hypothetical protein
MSAIILYLILKENIYTSSPINPSNPITVILTIPLFIQFQADSSGYIEKRNPLMLAPKNDTVATNAGDVAKDDKDKNKKDSATAKKPNVKVTIDFDGIEQANRIITASCRQL